ncbi:hypothetical protein RJ639_022248 [Escallonia herrerae]|uniref:BCAS3 domain-containing protein n=1 Tax=Escallonia herrerae TaxID=1293975 RepID=A0AA88V3G0_9ASTE|nr:hypothetical protein RJ639_022248 [Escallonia herrerae]
MPRSGRANGLATSFRALSRIMSSGASTVASTVRQAASAASAIVDRENDANNDQVYWAGFDKLECEGDITRQVLLLGYRFGFQVWDFEESDNVRELISRYDGPVSFMQMLPKLVASKRSGDTFADSRPLLAICADGSFAGGGYIQDGLAIPCNGNMQNSHEQMNGFFVPTVVWFYSLKSQSYIRVLRFRSVVYSVRCSTRIVAVLQAAQIHCFDASTLEREYTILTNPIVLSCCGSRSIGLGPLAVGPRWVAYSGTPVAVSNSRRVSPQHVNPSASFSGPASNGSLVAHYAKESSKHLAAGIVTLGDIGYKKLSRYYSELLPEGNNYMQSGSPGQKDRVIGNDHLLDADNVGMVIVRDVVSKSLIAQFRAHKSPISSLCFDPSGTLLVTASVQGHNINVFQIVPGFCGNSTGSDSGASYVHLYRLQRGLTNAVIQDISFSDDSQWVMISSSRGTSHLFAISPSGGSVNFQPADTCYTTRGSCVLTRPAIHGPPNLGLQTVSQQAFCASSPPVSLSAVSRIRSENNGWRSTVSGAAAAAAGRTGPLSGAIASVFHICKGQGLYSDTSFLKAKYHLLVFSSSGCVVQHAFRVSSGLDSAAAVSGLSTVYGSALECDTRLVVEAMQKWNICQKQNRRERDENIDIYGENGSSDSSKIHPEGIKEVSDVYSEARGAVARQNITTEERQHMYISEAELQMHQPRMPLWAKPEIYFQSMMKADVNIDMDDVLAGEIEIERIPTRMIEPRPKDLVPVIDHLQSPKFQHARVSALDSKNTGRILHQRSRLSENSRLVHRSSCDSMDSLMDGSAVDDLHNGIDDTEWCGLQMPTQYTKGFVNNNDSPKLNTRLHVVNNRASSVGDTHPKVVNNSIRDLKKDNQFDDKVDEFD